MTIATSTTVNLSIDRFNLGAWLSDLLLPSDEAQDAPTAESVIRAVSSWNAGEIADAIGSIIGAVCIDRYGNADTWTARLFTEKQAYPERHRTTAEQPPVCPAQPRQAQQGAEGAGRDRQGR